nr:TraB/GumN family protein [Bacteroidota bacterium]
VFYAEMDLSISNQDISQPVYDIRKFLSDKVIEKMRKQFIKSFHFDIMGLRHLHPLMIMSAISMSVLESEHMISLDEHLWQYAGNQGKPTRGLESAEEQMKILHTIDPQSIYRQLYKMSRRPSPVRKQTEKTIDLYVKGDIHQLYQLTKVSMQQLRKLVVYERNIKMSSVITQLDTSLSYFMTVGSGHLSGKFGLITLLKKSGWQIDPVKLNIV